MPCEMIFSFDQAMLCVLGVIVVEEPIEGESTYVLGLPAKLEPSEGANISARHLLPRNHFSTQLIKQCHYFEDLPSSSPHGSPQGSGSGAFSMVGLVILSAVSFRCRHNSTAQLPLHFPSFFLLRRIWNQKNAPLKRSSAITTVPTIPPMKAPRLGPE